MYHPYFRGKQYELIAIRETAAVISGAGFVPIIEPVRGNFRGLQKALDALCDAGGEAVVIVNPQHGQLKDDDNALIQWRAELDEAYAERDNISLGLLLDERSTTDQVIETCETYSDRSLVFIHAGFQEAGSLGEQLNRLDNVQSSVFLEDHCGKLYQRRFRSHRSRILVRDGFQRQRGRDYPDTEFFSDLHITFQDENVTGFGDFLIVGDEYSEGGGPAYTVVIHLTYIDPEQDETMMVKHYKSDSQETAQDPGGKFAEALEKLITDVDAGEINIFESSAIAEFRDLHERGHFPGLGYSKKLSMIHHIETMANFFREGEGGT